MYFFSSKLKHHCVPICHSPGGILDSLGVLLLMMENATTVQRLIIKFSICLSPVCYNISDRKSGSLLLKCSFTSVYLTTNPLLPQASLQSGSSVFGFFSPNLIFLFSFQQLSTIKLWLLYYVLYHAVWVLSWMLAVGTMRIWWHYRPNIMFSCWNWHLKQNLLISHTHTHSHLASRTAPLLLTHIYTLTFPQIHSQQNLLNVKLEHAGLCHFQMTLPSWYYLIGFQNFPVLLK